MKKKLLLLFSVITITLNYGHISMASPPVPQRKTSLDSIQNSLEQEKRRQNQLKESLESLEKELEETRTSLIIITKEIQENEANLDRLDKKIGENSAKITEITRRLEQDYGSIADLILALERMRRIPTESLIVKPGAPLQTAQTAMLLESSLPAINNHADELSRDLKKLGSLTQTLEKDRNKLLLTKKEQEQKLSNIKKLINKRENLYSRTQSDYSKNKQVVARLSREARTLMDLIAKLEKEQRTRESRRGRTTLIPNIGKLQLPVTGYMKQSFGQLNEIGSKNQGISIEARPGALAVSPMGGVVRFAGTFKNYGNMVIIEHKNGYHSLIAGLGRIDADVDTQLKAGEPLGQLPLTSSRGGRPALYYELRQNGQPINPATMFSELKT